MPAPVDSLEIRSLGPADPEVIARALAGIGWHHRTVDQYERYLREQAAGDCAVLVAARAGEFAGYLGVRWVSGYEPFRAAGVPEIVDLNVLPRFRRRGAASALMDTAE